MKTGILVLGMHRSGTSALTGCLPFFGVQLGHELMPASERNAKGFFESHQVCTLMNRYLAARDSQWDDYRPLSPAYAPQCDVRRNLTRLVEERFGNADLFAVKDPRNCRAVPLWLDIFNELNVAPVIVLPIRHPLAVSASLAERDRMPLDKALYLWLRHLLEAERETRPYKRVFIPYGGLLADWRPHLLKIGRLVGADWSARAEQRRLEVDAHLDKRLRHHAPDKDAATAMDAVGPWFRVTWRIMFNYAAGGAVRDDASTLDEINEDFTKRCQHFSHKLSGSKAASGMPRPVQPSCNDQPPHRQVDTGSTHPAAADSRSTMGFEHYVVVRSLTEATATVRLHSNPILHGIQRLSRATCTLHVPQTGVPLVIQHHCCLIFHYDDEPAIQTIRAFLRQATPRPTRIICLGSDIYAFADYTRLHDFVDLFMVPTELHRQLLQSQVSKPVYVLPEGVDPITISPDLTEAKAGKTGRHVVWFGYPDSFYKSMACLLPTINQAAANRLIDQFALIVDKQQFNQKYPNHFGFPLIPYANATFWQETQAFDYAILSHFSLDLAMNTYVKSPNKLVTALACGLIPIVSDTPNYRNLLEDHGLERFLFASPKQLQQILQNLDPVADSGRIEDSGILAAVLNEKSETRLLQKFFLILATYEEEATTEVTQLPLMTYGDVFR